MLTLAIDTSTNILSVALMREGVVLANHNATTKNNQSEILMSRIECMMMECRLKPTDLKRLAVAVGPGSYTGVRVGVVTAKSLAYALNISVVGVSSLEIMARLALAESSMNNDKVDVIVPMIDARRGTVFAGCYDAAGKNLITEGHYTLGDFLKGLWEKKSIIYIGDHSLGAKEPWIVHEGAYKGSKAVVLAALATNASPHKNIHTFVPNYLRKTEAELRANV